MANEIIESPAEKAPKKSKKRLILSLTLFILGVFWHYCCYILVIQILGLE